MSATTFNVTELFAGAPEPKDVPVPLGTPVSQVRSIALPSSSRPTTRLGVWECTPGRWVRQVVQAEFCHFLSGHAVFTPEGGGDPITLRAGDVAHFPANSRGHWDIVETSRKVFMVFDEEQAS
ncbi:cupin domain-containing protein [Sphingomonas sp. Ag1]|uniref:cupin domain-containing protein n=1 Tax=Sphingomonas sp. Ag1 TaxID=1642949 RepID=UPI00062231B6|nr:cupin domain-containing protein [Sphingomonas sp. Ag1]KKI22848.1 hypothetical protein XM50_00010 [Sphingomonas sp. Ag1]